MSEEERRSLSHQEQLPQQYGTFQGVANYPPPLPAVGLPQPVPPPGFTGTLPRPPPLRCYIHGYQPVQGIVVVEGRPVVERRLPCCGIGFGWFLFIIGFFIAAIPWYIAALVLICSRVDPREKPGYVACAIAAVLATIAAIFGLTRVDD